jgi:hypothetical protein
MVSSDATASISLGPFERLGTFVVDFAIERAILRAKSALEVKMPRGIKSR